MVKWILQQVRELQVFTLAREPVSVSGQRYNQSEKHRQICLECFFLFKGIPKSNSLVDAKADSNDHYSWVTYLHRRSTVIIMLSPPIDSKDVFSAVIGLTKPE